MDLTVKINKPVDDLKSLVLYKDGKRVALTEDLKAAIENSENENGEPLSKIKLSLSNAKPSDSGSYKLALAESIKGKLVETELAKTSLSVQETPIEIIEPFKASKDEYKEGEDITLTFTLSKPLTDKEKCITMFLNNKPVDLKSKNAELTENDTVYTITIKACELGKNDGEYTIKLKSKPNDAKSEFYSANITLNIQPNQVEEFKIIKNLNILPYYNPFVSETVTFLCHLSRPVNSEETLVFYKNENVLSPNYRLIKSTRIIHENNYFEVKFVLSGAELSDSAFYRLKIGENLTSDQIELIVQAKEGH